MQRVFMLVFVLVVAAASAQAASISVIREYNGSNPEDPGPGDSFTLRVIATANAGETAAGVFGRLVFYGGGSILPGATVQQTPLVSLDVIPWSTGVVGCDATSCDMFNQFVGVTPLPVSNTPLEIATVTFIISVPGSLSARWEDAGGFAFDFFGAPVPPDVCIIGFECPIIPEPATGALVAVGLVTLAATRRRA